MGVWTKDDACGGLLSDTDTFAGPELVNSQTFLHLSGEACVCSVFEGLGGRFLPRLSIVVEHTDSDDAGGGLDNAGTVGRNGEGTKSCVSTNLNLGIC